MLNYPVFCPQRLNSDLNIQEEEFRQLQQKADDVMVAISAHDRTLVQSHTRYSGGGYCIRNEYLNKSLN